MRKIGAFLIAAIIALLILTGCGGDPEWADTPLFEQTPVPVVIVDKETIPPTEPDAVGLEYGQIVWNVIRSEDGGDAYVVRSMVFAQDGDLVAVIPLFNPSPEETRAVMLDVAQMPKGEHGYLDLVLASNCYPNREQAQRVADRENGHP